MPLEVREIDPDKDFPALLEALIESYETPNQGALHAFLIHPGEGEEGRRKRLDEAATRFAAWHAADPSSYWQKVVDTETGEIAGAANWNVHSDNPFAHEHDLEVSWCPNDGSRRFTEQFLVQYATPRAIIGQRPQVYLYIIFTRPKYRRQGVGNQLMSWGVKKADEMGVEMFIDASDIGVPLYEVNGFTVAQENPIVPKTETEDEAWKEIANRIGSVTTYVMWRPAGGPYTEGKTPMPWKEA
ncbi:hypothetical protein F5Y16DRAFT_264754 [Xylariaceae sp. FL0255]|nr:hypothetical protein F5Y16DRAFT_264754 [Xylariaceae sp. FL0255]